MPIFSEHIKYLGDELFDQQSDCKKVMSKKVIIVNKDMPIEEAARSRNLPEAPGRSKINSWQNLLKLLRRTVIISLLLACTQGQMPIQRQSRLKYRELGRKKSRKCWVQLSRNSGISGKVSIGDYFLKTFARNDSIKKTNRFTGDLSF